MSNQIPLIVNAGAAQIQELAAGDTLSVVGNVAAGNILSDNYYYANGAPFSGSGGSYGNADVSTYLSSGTVTTDIITTGNVNGSNVVASYLWGDGSNISGLPAGYSNADVSTYLSSGTVTTDIITTGNISANNFTTTGSGGNITGANIVSAITFTATGNVNGDNVIATYLWGDGSNISGLPAGYSNADVSTYLSSGTVTTDIITTGNVNGSNVVASYLWGDGSNIINIAAGTQIINGTSNVSIPVTGGAVAIGVGGSDVVVLCTTNSTFTGNLNPVANATYSLGNATNQWQHLYVSNTTIYIGCVPLSTSNNELTFNGNSVITVNPTGTSNSTGNVSVTGTVAATYLYGCGANITGLSAGYSNADVSTYLASGDVTTNISTTGNVNAGNINAGALIFTTGNVNAIGGVNTPNVSITKSFVFTGLSGNANIDNSANFSTTGNVLAQNFFGNGIVSAGGNIRGGNINTAGIVTAQGNVYGSNVVGTYLYGCGANITGLPTSSKIANGSSNVAIATSNGPITFAVNGNAAGKICSVRVAIGSGAGADCQGANSVAIGALAGTTVQFANAVAVGAGAGQTCQGDGAIAIGAYAGSYLQPQHTIILNATGGAFNGVCAQTCSFYVNPIRTVNCASANVLYYDTTTKEIISGPLGSSYGNANVSDYLSSGGLSTDIRTTGNIYGNISGNVYDIGGQGILYICAAQAVVLQSLLTCGTGLTLGTSAQLIGNDCASISSVSANVLIQPGCTIWTFDQNNTFQGNGTISTSGNIYGGYLYGCGANITGVIVSAGPSLVNGTSNVVVANSGNITITAATSSTAWTFDTDGNLTSTSNSSVLNAAVVHATRGIRYNPTGTPACVPAGSILFSEPLGTGYLTGNPNFSMDIGGILHIPQTNTGPLCIGGAVNINCGNDLTLNGGGTLCASTSAIYGGYLHGCGANITGIASGGLTISTIVSTVSTLPSAATAGLRAFVSDSNLAASGNFGAIVAGGAGNNVPVFSDGTSWRIG